MSNVEQRPFVPAKKVDTDYPVCFPPTPSSGIEANDIPLSSSTVTRKLLKHQTWILGPDQDIDGWQAFQTSNRICAEVGLRCWSSDGDCGARIDASMGENCTFVGWKRRIRTYHASNGGNWNQCWILDVLPTVDMFVSPKFVGWIPWAFY